MCIFRLSSQFEHPNAAEADVVAQTEDSASAEPAAAAVCPTEADVVALRDDSASAEPAAAAVSPSTS